MVVVRDCVVLVLLFLCGRSTARHNIFEFVFDVLCCCVVGVLLGAGRSENLVPGVLAQCESCARS